MTWRNCRASDTLIAEIDKRWPNRSKVSDGTIGDRAHANRKSDHNPNNAGVVRARDITAAGIDAPWLAEFLRQRGAVGDARLTGGGYVIFDRKITLPNFSGWKPYTGSNPHVSHVHVSFSQYSTGYDSTVPWNIAQSSTKPTHGNGEYCRQGDRNEQVKRLQEFMVRMFPSYNPYRPTGFYGIATTDGVREFQRRVGVTGPDANGKVVGPRTLAKLIEHGFVP